MSEVVTGPETQTVVVPGDAVSVVQTPSNVVVTDNGATGPQGAQGPVGAIGPQGVSGVGDKHHETSFVGTNATITHDLGKYPAVTVLTTAGDEIVCDVEYLNINQLQIMLATSSSVTVLCN